MSKDKFHLRVDVSFSEKNMQYNALEWLQDRYIEYAGTKADFIRDLIIKLYKYETGLIKDKDDSDLKEELKVEVKEEILGYLMNQLNNDNLMNKKEDKEEITKEISDNQAKAQDLLLGQLDI